MGNDIYQAGGNLNTKSLKDLKGKVITVFAKPEKIKKYGPNDGILGVKNLQKAGAYDDNYDGLQYYGKGGTKATKYFFKKQSTNFDKKIDENFE